MTSTIKVDTIQNSSGTTGISINSNGVITTPAKPAFHVTKNNSQTCGGGGGDLVTWDTVNLDVSSAFSSSVYTVPVTGVYFISVQWLSPSTATQTDIYLRKNGTYMSRSRNAAQSSTNAHETTTINWIGNATAGDTIDVIINASGQVIYGDSNGWTYFMGYLI